MKRCWTQATRKQECWLRTYGREETAGNRRRFRNLKYKIVDILAARHLYFSIVLAARKKNLTTGRARKNKHIARMLANARKDH